MINTSTVWIEGVIKQNRGSILNITHAPVPDWGWPAMTMDFDLNQSVDETGVSKGQAVWFEVEEASNVGYQILAVESIDGIDAGQSLMDHSQTDHSQMDHSQTDHSSMNMDAPGMPEMNHSKMGH